MSYNIHYATKKYYEIKETAAVLRFSIFFAIIAIFWPLRRGVKRVKITFFCKYKDYIEMKNHSAEFESHEWNRRFLFEVQNLWSNLKWKRSQNV